MKQEEVKLDKFTVVGISVRTTNQNYQSQKDIADLWDMFFSRNIIGMIPNKISNDIYCIYTDYESDFTGEYTTILGCKVSDTNKVPADLTIKEIPETKYYKYLSEGELPYAVGRTWAHIWKSEINRAYVADFDIYGEEAQDPKNARLTTFLSIK